jgi:hypothetical protein
MWAHPAVMMPFISLENKGYPRDLVNHPLCCPLNRGRPHVLSSPLRSHLSKCHRFYCPFLPPRECDGVDVNQFCGCGMAFQAMRMGNKIVFNWKFQDTLSFLQSELGSRPPFHERLMPRAAASLALPCRAELSLPWISPPLFSLPIKATLTAVFNLLKRRLTTRTDYQ